MGLSPNHTLKESAARRTRSSPSKSAFEATAGSGRAPSRKNLGIFIAGNNEMVRRGIRACLEERPEWRIVGESGTRGETITQTAALQPDLLLLDVTGPSFEAAKVIGQVLRASPAIKIIALGRDDEAESAVSALVGGAIGLVLESDAASEFVRTIQQVSEDHPFLSPAAVGLIGNQLARHQTVKFTPADLTPRETEILAALARGSSNKEVANELGISVKTVNVHRSNMMDKLSLCNSRRLIHFAIRQGIAACSRQ